MSVVLISHFILLPCFFSMTVSRRSHFGQWKGGLFLKYIVYIVVDNCISSIISGIMSAGASQLFNSRSFLAIGVNITVKFTE
jgi:hypothetical protein